MERAFKIEIIPKEWCHKKGRMVSAGKMVSVIKSENGVTENGKWCQENGVTGKWCHRKMQENGVRH